MTTAPPRIDPAIIRAIAWVESRNNPNAVSKAGARGLLQVMPDTARKIGCDPARLFEPEYNVMCGTRYLEIMLDHFHGDMEKALAAYYAGPKYWHRGLNYARRVLRLKETL
jgi:soluble lytic murein transglycosylase-like protein